MTANPFLFPHPHTCGVPPSVHCFVPIEPGKACRPTEDNGGHDGMVTSKGSANISAFNSEWESVFMVLVSKCVRAWDVAVNFAMNKLWPLVSQRYRFS